MGKFLALVSFVITSTAAWAEPTPVVWDQGTVSVVGDHIAITFKSGEIMKLANVHIVPETGYGTSNRTRMEYTPPPQPVVGETQASNPAAAPKVEFLFGLDDMPSAGMNLQGLKVAKVKLADGSIRLIWVAADKIMKTRFNAYNGYIGESSVQPLGDGRWTVTRFADMVQTLPTYPNELGIISRDKDQYTLLVYDDWDAMLTPVLFHLQNPRAGATGVAAEPRLAVVNQSRHYPLPAAFERGRPFSEEGELFEQAPGELYVVKLKTGEALRLGNVGDRREQDPGNGSRYEKFKLSSRVLWTKGVAATRKYIARQGADTNGESPEISKLLGDWFLRANSGTDKSKTSVQRGGLRENLTAAYLTISPMLSEKIPSIRYDVVGQILNAREATAGKADLNSVVYVKLPKYWESNRLSEICAAIGNQIVAVRGANANVEPVLLLDILDGTDWYEVKLIPVLFETLRNTLNNLGTQNIRLMVLANREQVEAIGAATNFTAAVKDPIEISVDQSLNPAIRTRLVREGLQAKGFDLPVATIEGILAQIDKENVNKSMILSDLSLVANNLATVLNYITVRPDEAGFIETSAKLYAQISGVRRVGPFPHELLQKAHEIPRLLSTSYPGHSTNAMSGRDWLLRDLETKLVSWMAYGHRDYPMLPLFFAGDNGTGKTMTANGLAEVLGAAVETVNLSSLPKPKTYLYSESLSKSDENLDLKPIQDRVEKLVLDPNPLKILILDELHTYPEIFNQLLPAFGNTDRKAPGVLNLDGIIVIMIANVDIESEPYKNLSRMNPIDRGYPQQLFHLFKASLANGKAKVDEKLVGALAGRLLPGMMFFPPLGMDKEQQASLVDRMISEFEARNKMRIVIQDAAKSHLQEVAASYIDGNYRAVERAVRQEITAAFGRFISTHPDAKLQGYFVLGATQQPGEKPVLDLLEVEGDTDGIGAVVHDSYLRFIEGMQGSLTYAIDMLKHGKAVGEFSRRNFEQMATVFALASKAPLFESGKPRAADSISFSVGGGLVPFPSNLPFPVRKKVDQYIADSVKPVFDSFADYTLKAGALKEKDALLAMAEKANRVLAALTRVQKAELSGGDTSRPFSKWIEAARAKYVADKKAEGIEVNIPEGSIEALGVAAGYLISDLGRKSAVVMFNNLKHEADKKVLSEAPSGAAKRASSTIPASAECERILLGGQKSAAELDKLFN